VLKNEKLQPSHIVRFSAGFRWWETWGPGVVGGPMIQNVNVGDDR